MVFTILSIIFLFLPPRRKQRGGGNVPAISSIKNNIIIINIQIVVRFFVGHRIK